MSALERLDAVIEDYKKYLLRQVPDGSLNRLFDEVLEKWVSHWRNLVLGKV